MEKSQYNLCIEILRRFHKAGLLNDFILIGSWAMVFYKEQSVFEDLHPQWQKWVIVGLEALKQEAILSDLKERLSS